MALEREDLRVDLENRMHCPLWYATMGGHARVLQLLLGSESELERG
jgi:hypothetical protein